MDKSTSVPKNQAFLLPRPPLAFPSTLCLLQELCSLLLFVFPDGGHGTHREEDCASQVTDVQRASTGGVSFDAGMDKPDDERQGGARHLANEGHHSEDIHCLQHVPSSKAGVSSLPFLVMVLELYRIQLSHLSPNSSSSWPPSSTSMSCLWGCTQVLPSFANTLSSDEPTSRSDRAHHYAVDRHPRRLGGLAKPRFNIHHGGR